MRVALGFKAHSGWAALVVVGESKGELVLVDRRRIELADEAAGKMPYHAAEKLPIVQARALVDRLVKAAHRCALREVKAAVERENDRGNKVVAGAVLTGTPMPEWTTDEILAVHFRMHKAEGVLFRDVLCKAVEACGVRLTAISEKEIAKPSDPRLAALGKTAGPPWGKDQKDATQAAAAAL